MGSTLPRLIRMLTITFALPASHALWGSRPPGGERESSGTYLGLCLVGLLMAAVYLTFGPVVRNLFRKRGPRAARVADLILYLLILAAAVYGGVTASYLN